MKNASFIGCILCVSALVVSAQTWVDISSALVQSKAMTFPGGIANCSGVCVNRLTGDVVVKFIDNGMWRSTDKGTSWTRIDNTTVSGRCESGWAVQVDQNNPTRIAVFSLDGTSGYTADGTAWTKINSSPAAGRGFDFGSVDWGTAGAKVMLASAHESGGQIALSTDGGNSWTMLSVTFNGANPNSGSISMLGVMDANTLIYGSGSGIRRSTDLGATWSQVSTSNPQTRVAVFFNGKHYLGTSTGLLVSTDKGATWQTKGATVNIYQGPYFGSDENTMVVAGPQGVYKSTNAGTAWTKISAWTPSYSGNTFDPSWFGMYGWDPVNNEIYATRMVCPAYKLDLGPVSVHEDKSSAVTVNRMTIANATIHSAVGFDRLEIYSISGALLYRRNMSPTTFARVPQLADITRSTAIFRISTSGKSVGELVR